MSTDGTDQKRQRRGPRTSEPEIIPVVSSQVPEALREAADGELLPAQAPLLASILDALSEAAPGRAWLELSLADPRIDWAALQVDPRGAFDASVPREQRSPRTTLPDGGALEVRIIAQRGVAQVRRLARDPKKDPLGHLWKDTRVPTGAAVGAAAGLLLSRGRAAVAAASAVAGGVVGWRMGESAPRVIWILEHLGDEGTWRARRMVAAGRAGSDGEHRDRTFKSPLKPRWGRG